MKKILIILIIIVVSSGGYFAYDNYFNPNNKETTQGTFQVVDLNYENLDKELEKTGLVRSIPENFKIELNFYNFDTGEREIEKTYILTTSNVYEGNEDSDVTLYMHSKYIEGWNTGNFCSVMTSASKNGDFSYETKLSEVKLAWKLKSMAKYKDCFGI